MSAFVLDASMALSWLFQDETSSRSRAIEDLSDEHQLVVPAHWFAEVANGMLNGERRRRTTADEARRFVERIGTLDIEIDTLEPGEMFTRILPLARAHKLTIYDTPYLELAERRGLPLASFDDDLNAAARSVGVALVEEAA